MDGSMAIVLEDSIKLLKEQIRRLNKEAKTAKFNKEDIELQISMLENTLRQQEGQLRDIRSFLPPTH